MFSSIPVTLAPSLASGSHKIPPPHPMSRMFKDLIEEGAHLIIHDPKVDPKQISMELGIDPINNIIEEDKKRKIKLV